MQWSDVRSIIAVGLPGARAAGSSAERYQSGAGRGVVPARPASRWIRAGGQTHIYISDTQNSRVLGWADVASYQIGDAPGVVLGQPGPQYSNLMGIGVKGFNAPIGLAVDPLSGNLYVADFNNSRVVRFQSPFANPTRIEPDAVYGQPNFNSRTASTPSSTSLNQPRAVAFDSAGNLWVADTRQPSCRYGLAREC